jgi:8-amino-7-oxononanoate synthase
MNWLQWVDHELELLRRESRWRTTQAFDARGPTGMRAGRDVISFCSNDYLGLSQHPAVCRAAHEAIEQFGTGATASRYICGTRTLHLELEALLAQWKQTACAAVFPTGFAANLGVLAVFGTQDTLLLSDELNHASIVDGCRLAKGRTMIYGHRDLEHLAWLLGAHRGRSIVISDSVFSMDGTLAPVEQLVELCARHDALLVLDEAHAVLGPEVAAPLPNLLRVGTLSKALGALGGWVAGPRPLIELLMNRARSLIFTTALSPADTAAAMAALNICNSAEGEMLRRQLRQAIDYIAPRHPSPIVPIILGTEQAALEAAEQLLSLGLLVPAIRPPTVPAGTARLRVALSAAHTSSMLERLRQALTQLTPLLDGRGGDGTPWHRTGFVRQQHR